MRLALGLMLIMASSHVPAQMVGVWEGTGKNGNGSETGRVTFSKDGTFEIRRTVILENPYYEKDRKSVFQYEGFWKLNGRRLNVEFTRGQDGPTTIMMSK